MGFLLFIAILTSCNTGSDRNNLSSKAGPDSIGLARTQYDSQDSIVLFLLNAAAKDFHGHQPPVPLGFRHVQFKYLTKSDREKTYLLCGQFLNKDNQNKEEWIYFATIKTDPYEQWMGSNALTYCKDSKEIPYTKIDLSVALKSRYDSLQKSGK